MKLQRAIIVLVILVLSGCGYHLRGSGRYALASQLSSVYVDAAGAQAVGARVRQQLGYSGVKLAGSPRAAEAIVKLSDEAFDRRVLSVDSDTGKVAEYELGYEVKLAISRADGTVVIEPRTITLQRDVTFDTAAVIGKFEEEQQVRDDMTEDAAIAVLRQLEAVESQ